VVVVHEQFPSNVYTWKRKVDEAGASLRTVEPRNGQRTSEAWSDAILNTIDASTAIVAVPHVHWADGTVFDLPAIGARARDVGAALVVDGTQSVGAYPFPFDQVQPDAVICAGYKWLLGPYSIGLAWYGPRLDGGVPLEENWISRLGSRDFAGLVEYQPRYEAGAARYDVGERSNFILVPMMLAALEMLKGWGVENIQARCRHLVAPVAEAAAALGYEIADASSRADHLFGIRAPGRITAAELRAAMERRNVSVSVRGDAVRVAPNVYNDEDDLSALLEALEVVARGSE
jgi:selenocysteine lyase/cysteine desulfurase